MRPRSIMLSELPGTRVFIVDDDAAVRQAVTLLVQSLGLPAQAYASAQAFLEAYDPASDGCLVLDLHMPGMNGVELQRELTARGVRIPVIVITAYKDDPLTASAQEAGAVTVLYKPFKQDLLLRSIESALDPH
jgi:two-component system, LuxR family, response regulator FixJ